IALQRRVSRHPLNRMRARRGTQAPLIDGRPSSDPGDAPRWPGGGHSSGLASRGRCAPQRTDGGHMSTETTPATGTGSSFGVHSEVGKLRKVMVHRPGLEHRRLTPSNAEDLLFDDVIWVDRAEQE